MQTTDIEILKEIISVYKNYQGEYSDEEIAILKVIYRIVNARIDRNKCYHSETTGKFINKYSYEAQEYMMTILAMDIAEFKQVESEIDTWYYDRYKKEPIIEHYMSDFIYYASNKGFHKYLFFDKIINDGTRKDWD